MNSIRLGSKGELVKYVQQFLGIEDDGIFGKGTQKAVEDFQRSVGLYPDGIVGEHTFDKMGFSSLDDISTDTRDRLDTSSPFPIDIYLLPNREFMWGCGSKSLYLHHTAGWNNPYNVVDAWANDKRGEVATKYVLGGGSIKGNDNKYDGLMVDCLPEGGWGWHLGTGKGYMHQNSVGIELCNFGYLEKGGYTKWVKVNNRWKPQWVSMENKNGYYTYVGVEAEENQVVTLKKPFRGFSHWHKYSEKQLYILKRWIVWQGEKHSIDVRKGLIERIKDLGQDGFEYTRDALLVDGMWTHTNCRKDKFDLSPQPDLIDMLLSI